jgi:DNA-binding GntR family transcriptional regulator
MVGAIAPAIEDTTLARLDRILGYQAAAVKAKDTEEFYALDVRFHTMLFDRLAMRRVAEVVETSRAQLERTRRLLLPTPGRNQNTLREHRAIFAALQLRDPVKAARAMGEHLDEVMAELKRFAAQQPDLFEP